MSKLRIGVIFGGRSEEHPISVKSAREVAAHLDPERYEPYWIGITQAGAWTLCDGPSLDGATVPAVISPDPSVHGLLLSGGETLRLDVVFPVLHGRWGEDGAMQGLLELSGIPYVGCDIAGSAIAMDKALAYVVAGAAGIATPTFWTVLPGESPDASRFSYPVFVKPARSGSSFGVTKVSGANELADAIEAAREFDTRVLIEQAVVGSEIGCAVMGNDGELTLGEVDRVDLSHGFFRIHQETNPEGGSENSTFIVPADITPEHRARVQYAARKIYRALGCRGLARVDMFLLPDGSVMLNEVNTLPGLTSYSRYPRMMKAAGLSLTEVIDRLVALALDGSAR